MLKVAATSKRGAKIIRKHGNIWVPVRAEKRVPCLGMRPGIQLMSLKDRHTFWILVQDDPHIVAVDRLDGTGKSMLPPKPGRTHLDINVDWNAVSDTTSQQTVKEVA